MLRLSEKRILEIMPGLLIWVTFIFALLLSVLSPLWAIIFIIVFDVYWVCRIFYMLIYMFTSWRRFRRSLKIDWQEKVTRLEGWNDYYHLIFLPTYKEPYEVIENTFKSICNSKYDLKKFIIVLAGEKRDENNFLPIAEKIKSNFENRLYKLIVTMHDVMPDELPGKGSNINYAGHQAKKYIDESGISYSKVIVSAFDVDTRPHPQYFACLTYHFITSENPYRNSFQPIAVYNNNVWESNPIVRVVASSTTFWLLTDLSRQERLFTFSSHSMSFKALVDVNFWDKTIVTEDSRIFLQCFVQYDGNYQVTPLYIPLYMNTVDVGEIKKSLINQYKQMRRWAWGVEHFPWMFRHFWGEKANKKIPFMKKIYYIWNQTEGVYSWATAPILIFLVGHLPIWLASGREKTTALFQTAPNVLAILMRVAMIGLVSAAAMYTVMLPPKPKHFSRINYLIMILQWFIVPVTLILFGSIPAADAQTRLMLGGKFRLGFWVSEKKV
ncbi:glycosyltransferase family 2 protein [Candidatus Parcubacteria bacterium]|nr:MAG: glycosyltransferase family 2 protein [Candidatus Parcubacteria bacterium]